MHKAKGDLNQIIATIWELRNQSPVMFGTQDGHGHGVNCETNKERFQVQRTAKRLCTAINALHLVAKEIEFARMAHNREMATQQRKLSRKVFGAEGGA